MMTLMIAAAAAAAQPAPAPAMQMGDHNAQHAQKEKCCCDDMAKKGDDHAAGHADHGGR